jgi:hypothetical protein
MLPRVHTAFNSMNPQIAEQISEHVDDVAARPHRLRARHWGDDSEGEEHGEQRQASTNIHTDILID